MMNSSEADLTVAPDSTNKNVDSWSGIINYCRVKRLQAQISNNCFSICVQLLLLHKLRNFYRRRHSPMCCPLRWPTWAWRKTWFLTHIHEKKSAEWKVFNKFSLSLFSRLKMFAISLTSHTITRESFSQNMTSPKMNSNFAKDDPRVSRKFLISRFDYQSAVSKSRHLWRFAGTR